MTGPALLTKEMKFLASLLFIFIPPHAFADPEGCKFSDIEVEQLKEFVKIKEYLTKKAFPSWEKEMPPMFVYNLQCQYVLNYPNPTLEGFSDTKQVIEIP